MGGNLSNILGSGLGTEAESSLSTIAGGAAGSILSTAIGDIASVVPYIGPIIKIITSFIGISGGCGTACVASSKGEQVFEVAGDDITKTVKAGMLNGQDGVAILGVIKQQGEQFLTKLIEQGDSKAQDGLTNMDKVINNLISVASKYSTATEQLDIEKAQSLFISTSNQGWYVESVVSGNAMATQLLQAYLQSGITAAQNADVQGTYDTLLSSLSQQLTAAQNSHTSVTSDILGGIAGVLGLAQAGSTDTGTKVLSGILGTIGLSENTSNTIAGDISTALGDITKTVNILNTDIIGKLVNPVLTSINNANTLQTALESDLKNGLTGILQIPSQLAGYLTSQAAISKQATDLTNENRTNVASTILTPGIGGAISDSVKALHDSIKVVLGTPTVGVQEFGNINITEPAGSETFAHDIDAANKFINETQLFGVPVFKGLLAVVTYVLALGSKIVPFLEEVEQTAKIGSPVEPLGIGEIVEALHRNLLSMHDAIIEAGRQGIDTTRLTLLDTLAEKIIDVGDAINAYYRGIITQEALQQELDYVKYDRSRQQVLLELAKFLPDVGTAADWYARNFITTEQFRQILQSNRWTPDEIDIAEQAIFRPANSSEYTRYKARIDAASNGFLADSYGSNPPDDVNNINRQNRLSVDQSKLDWIAHWRELGLYDYVNAYFRGLIDDNVYSEALGSLNLPPELNKLITDVNRPLIPFFYLTEMLAAGIFTEDQATAYLKQYGFSDDSVKASIKFGNFKALGKATDQNNALAQLSISTLKTMFDDGVINRSQLIIALEEHGYNSEVSILLADLYETENNLKENKAYANLLITKVKNGDLTKLQALDALNARGFTQIQVETYAAQIDNIKVTSAKLPSKAEFDAFWKKGLISDEDYTTALELLGYNQKYATLFLTYLQS